MRASKFDSKKSKSGDWDYPGMGGRYDDYDYDDLLAGFATSEDHPFFFEVIPEEEEEVVVIEEEKTIHLERGPYYERHDKAIEEIELRKIKNFILHKKLAIYFKRKKVDYVTKETDWSFDGQSKYFKKLEAYGDLIDCISIEKGRLTKEIEDTRKKVDEKGTKLTSMFKKMQDREAEIGYGLISTKTGNVLLDKFVERLIRRQYTQMMQVSSMRLTYIRLKGMVQEKLDAIARLDEIAPGFQLADYEQLKSDNRAYADKIEEKDEELSRLRAKCGNTIQVLAHLREKTTALETDLTDLIEERFSVNNTVFSVRSQLNETKQRRDSFRHATNRMKDDSGLLTQPTLLIDMENGFEENKSLTVELKKLMREYKKKARQIQIIRKKIEETVDTKRCIARKSASRVAVRKDSGSNNQLGKIYKGRPALMMPTIEDSAFNSLRTIKPKFTYDRSIRNRAKVKKEKRKEG